MIRPRVIPCLLLQDKGLVKTVRFKNPKYLGDPINIVRIFNDKEVDELVFLDITATAENRSRIKNSFGRRYGIQLLHSDCLLMSCVHLFL